MLPTSLTKYWEVFRDILATGSLQTKYQTIPLKPSYRLFDNVSGSSSETFASRVTERISLRLIEAAQVLAHLTLSIGCLP